jgi:hypothetical protein
MRNAHLIIYLESKWDTDFSFLFQIMNGQTVKKFHGVSFFGAIFSNSIQLQNCNK